MMDDQGLRAEGIKFVLDEEGITNSSDRLILTKKFTAYLMAARNTTFSEMNSKINTRKSGKNTSTMNRSK